MFNGSGANAAEETVIAQSLKIEGQVTADGLVRVKGKIIGDLRCTALIIADTAEITGTVVADSVVVDGIVDGPIRSTDVVLKSNSHVTGDIHHTSLTIEKGAIFDGRSRQAGANEKKTAAKSTKPKKRSAAANDDATETSASAA